MIFRQPGSYPGIPGLFAGCHIAVDAAGNVSETPLSHYPAEDLEPPPEQEAPPIEQATIVQEQAAPTPAPQFIGG